MAQDVEKLINYFQGRVRDKNLTKEQRIYAYGRLRQLRYNELNIYKIKSKYLFQVDEKSKFTDHYVLTVKNDGRNNFLITPIMTHEGSKEEILRKNNCLDVSSMKGAKFDKNSQIYPKLRDKKYHQNSNIKPDILHNSKYYISLLQVPQIENFLYDNKNKNIAKENRDLKDRWRKRRMSK